jgi:hypothetical protein
MPYYSKDYVIDGSFLRLDDADKAWAEIDGRIRTAIRKAQKSAVEIRRVEPTPANIAAFTKFCMNSDDLPSVFTDRYHLFFAYLHNGIVVVAVGSKLFMLCHASKPVAKEHEIPSLLIWHVMQEFAGSEFKYLDVGASYRYTLQRFFSGWQTTPYPMIMKPPELQPQLQLTPFDTKALGEAVHADHESIVPAALSKFFDNQPYTFFPRAMYGICTLIKHLKNKHGLGDTASVWITTNTDSPYVSSCATSAIEQSLSWTRGLTDQTAVIFCIHEFGFPHPRLQQLRKIADDRGILLIEDCAYGWGTAGIGQIGDYSIYSLAKTFPLQFGGYITGVEFDHQTLWNDYGCSDRGKQEYTEARLASWLPNMADSAVRRRKNYEWYTSLFGADRTVFMLNEATVPGAYVLAMNSEEKMQIVSAFVRRFGIECGNYWQNAAITLPVHQRLELGHLEYIAGAVLATEREWCGVPDAPLTK